MKQEILEGTGASWELIGKGQCETGELGAKTTCMGELGVMIDMSGV